MCEYIIQIYLWNNLVWPENNIFHPHKSLRGCQTYMQEWSGSSLVQVIACLLFSEQMLTYNQFDLQE